MDEMLVAMGSCFTCQNLFAFDPYTVLAIVVDPATGQPVPAGGPRPPDAVNMPVCDTCIEVANEARARQGLPPLPRITRCR